MRELTQLEYQHAFGTKNDKQLRLAIEVWNDIHPEDPVKPVERRATKTLQVYRDNLPADLEAVLVSHERIGTKYIEGFFDSSIGNAA